MESIPHQVSEAAVAAVLTPWARVFGEIVSTRALIGLRA